MCWGQPCIHYSRKLDWNKTSFFSIPKRLVDIVDLSLLRCFFLKFRGFFHDPSNGLNLMSYFFVSDVIVHVGMNPFFKMDMGYCELFPTSAVKRCIFFQEV